jgi:hypothetical protein
MSGGGWLAAVTHVDDIVEFADSRKPVWIEVTGLTDVSTVETVGQAFDYHRLTLEDVVSDATLQDGATIIDHYFPVMETLDDHLDDVEDELLSATTADAVSLARSARLELQTLRHVVWPMRGVLTSLLRDDTGVVTDDTRVYFRDCSDHLMQLQDMIEMSREMAATVLEAHASTVAPILQRLARWASPLVWVLAISTETLARIFGLRRSVEPHLTGEGIHLLILRGIQTGVFNPLQRDLIDRVVRFVDRSAAVVMTPHPNLVWLLFILLGGHGLPDAPDREYDTIGRFVIAQLGKAPVAVRTTDWAGGMGYRPGYCGRAAKHEGTSLRPRRCRR